MKKLLKKIAQHIVDKKIGSAKDILNNLGYVYYLDDSENGLSQEKIDKFYDNMLANEYVVDIIYCIGCGLIILLFFVGIILSVLNVCGVITLP